MPQFRNLKHYYEKRYVVVVKKRSGIQTFFFYNHLCRNSVIRNIIIKSGVNIFYVTKVCRILKLFLEAVLKIADYVQGHDANRFESGVYTIVFEHFESVCNTALGR
jgi:hypothetical protein